MNRIAPPACTFLVVTAALLAAAPAPAHAETTCTASSTGLAFGPVTGASAVDTTGQVTITCTTTAIQIAASVRVRACLNIDAGLNGGGQMVPRRMTNATSDALGFQIYQDLTRTQVWGNSANALAPTPRAVDLIYGYVLLIGSGTGTATATMYGRVPVQTGLAAGTYTNPFTGTQTRLDYRYAEPILIGVPPFPATCTSGGDGGGSVTFPFTATANVPANCTISTATALDFGTVPGVISTPRDQTSTITFACTGRTPWNVGLNNGLNASGNTRRMRQLLTNNYVNYELYRDASHTQRWGTTIGTDTQPGTGTGAAQAVTVHGRVPASQSAALGAYSDTVTVTVTY